MNFTKERQNDGILYASATPDEEERSQWLIDALQNNPEIMELRKCLYPLQRTCSFVKIYHPGKRDIKSKLNREYILQLILQHLQAKGFRNTRRVLEQETKVKTPETNLRSSKLVKYLKDSIRDVERVYDLSVADKFFDENDPDVPLEEQLYEMGLLTEDIEEQEDTNIWIEPQSNIIVEKTLNKDVGEEVEAIKAGSFNKLVERLTDETKHDMRFVKTFLMTYQSFSTPEKLLAKLIERFNVPSSYRGGSEEGKGMAGVIQIRATNVIKAWLESYPNDFNDNLIQQLKYFIEQISQAGRVSLSNVLNKALNKMQLVRDSQQEGESVDLTFTDKRPEPQVPQNIFAKSLSIHDLDDLEISRQLTLLEFEIYSQIQPAELLNQAWSKPKLKHRSPNVLKLIRRFNMVSNWVAVEIVQLPTVKERAKMMSRFIKIADNAQKLNNFNSVMSIIAGLNYAAIHRLKHTREELPASIQKMRSDIEMMLSNKNNFSNYRQTLLNSEPPCLPYLGVYLTDLTFIEENPNNLNGLINFSKRNLVFNVISLLQQYQQKAYNLQPVYQIASFLNQLPHIDEHECYHLSLKREPRGKTRAEIP